MTTPSTNPLQDDYVRYPPSTRARYPELAALWKKHAEDGLYHLKKWERWWADIQPYLLSKAYQLRPRYAPGWEPVWIGTDINPRCFEESVGLFLWRVIDAKRVSDGTVVAIKWIPDAEYTRNERDIMFFLSSGDRRDDPQNHCNPLLDSFPHPDDPHGILIVTPWLADFVHVPHQTVGGVVEMLRQLLEGLAFMHRNGVAHRDCTGLNIMQDIRACFPGKRTHPLESCYSEDMQTMYDPDPDAMRTFYFIDFGVSSWHEGPGPHLVTGNICRDKTAPEMSTTIPYDPFKLDIYLLGNHFLERYLKKFSNLEFLRPVLLAMTNASPAARPTASGALVLLAHAMQSPLGMQLRWRLRERDENWAVILIDDTNYLVREASRQLRKLFG